MRYRAKIVVVCGLGRALSRTDVKFGAKYEHCADARASMLIVDGVRCGEGRYAPRIFDE